jgi:superfamily II DNA/RNA helicase
MSWPGDPFHKNRFRDVLGAAASPAIERYIGFLQQAQQEHYPNMELHRWQMLAAATILAGQDCFTITATGSGKSFSYQLLTLDNRKSIILVICPLIALMDDQVMSAARLGIKAAAIHAHELDQRPELLTEIRQGEYQIVLAGPEFCVPDDVRWMQLTTDCTFSDNLRCVVVDEAHLCHAWRRFRPTIDGLFRLKNWFRVPFMVMSATMTPYVRAYVHHSLRLPGSTPIIHRPVDRPEIYLCTRIAQHPLETRKDLDFLFQPEMTIMDIVPTIVFTDSRSEVTQLTESFWNRAPAHWFEINPFVFAEISSALSAERRALVIQAVRNGLVKILFATQIAEVGLDFGNIVRVVQWRVPLTLTAAALWQRFGRACRRRGMNGIGILIVQSTLVITPGSQLAVLLEKPGSNKIERIMRLIHTNDAGRNNEATIPLPHGWANAKQPPFEVNPVQVTQSQQRKRRRLDMPMNSQALLMDPSDDSDDDNSEDHDFEGTNELTDSDVSDEASSDDEFNHDIVENPDSTIPDVEEETHDLGPADVQPLHNEDLEEAPAATNDKRHLGICRMILWLVNTQGCIRECMMRYLDEANFQEADYAFPTVPEKPCCDRHTPSNLVNDELHQLLPEYIFGASKIDNVSRSDGNSDRASDSASHHHTPKLPEPSSKQIDAIQTQLRQLRRDIWRALGLMSHYSPYPSFQLLSEEAITMLAKKSASIVAGASDILDLLDIDRNAPAPDPLVDYVDDISRAIKSGWEAAPPLTPKGRGRPRRVTPEIGPPFDINPHADLDHEDVQLALSQAQHARGGQRRAQRQPEGQSSTLRYADETGLHPDVQKLLGKRPKGRPSKAKIEARNAEIANALEQLGLQAESEHP